MNNTAHHFQLLLVACAGILAAILIGLALKHERRHRRRMRQLQMQLAAIAEEERQVLRAMR